jgi:hypothetical protein
MTNKEFIKQDIHFSTKKKKDSNAIVRILNAFQEVLGLMATICWVLLLSVIAVITIGSWSSRQHSNRVVDKFGNTIYK